MVHEAEKILRNDPEKEYDINKNLFEKRNIDMDNFPLIPLSQIPFLSTALLEKCEKELIELCSPIYNNEEEIDLSKYAQRQLLAIKKEKLDRISKERILKLLYSKDSYPLSNEKYLIKENTKDFQSNEIFQTVRNDIPIINLKVETNLLLIKIKDDINVKAMDTNTPCLSEKTEELLDKSKYIENNINNNQSIPNTNKSNQKIVDKYIKTSSLIKKETKTIDWSSSFIVEGSRNKKNRKKIKSQKQKDEEEAKNKLIHLEKQKEERRKLAEQRLLLRKQRQTEKKKKKQSLKDITAKTHLQNIKTIPETNLSKIIENDTISNDSEETESDSDDGITTSSEDEYLEPTSSLLIETEVVTPCIEINSEEHTKIDKNSVIESESNDEDTNHEDIYEEDVEDKVNQTEMKLEERSSMDIDESMDTTKNVIFPLHIDASDKSTINEKDKKSQVDKEINEKKCVVENKDERVMSIENELNKLDEDMNRLKLLRLKTLNERNYLDDMERTSPIHTIRNNLTVPIASTHPENNQLNDKVNTIQKDTVQNINKLSIQSKNQENNENIVKKKRQSIFKFISSKDTSFSYETTREETPAKPEEVNLNIKKEKILPNWLRLTGLNETTNQEFALRKSDIEKTDFTIHENNVGGNDEKNILSKFDGDKKYRKDIVDYSSFYSCFNEIFSFFHERNNSSLKKTNKVEIINNESSILRYQLKLYTVWKNIMIDYATVFTPSTQREQSLEEIHKKSLKSESCHFHEIETTAYTFRYKINSTTRGEVIDIVSDACKKIPDYKEQPEGLGLKTTWNLLWTWSKPKVDRSTLLVWQKVNHFPGAKALTRKDLLKKTISYYTSLGGKMTEAFRLQTDTFILPNEYIPFVNAFTKQGENSKKKKNLWIMKPVGLSRGRGISLFNDIANVRYGEQIIVQKYVEDPLLLNGYKFDLRIYVLVTSFNPLEAFLYTEGFARICTHKYNTDITDISNLYIHLTNSSIQKYNITTDEEEENPLNKASDTEAGGTKITLSYLWIKLAEDGKDVETIKENIKELIIKSLVCAEDQIPYQINSFEVFGYDVLLDEDCRPWLVEVNSSPSMARENSLDEDVKNALIYDTIRLINPLQFDRYALIEILKKKLEDIEKDKKKQKVYSLTEENIKDTLNKDILALLYGKKPRLYGELPEYMGKYERLCPSTKLYNKITKFKNSFIRPDKNRKIGQSSSTIHSYFK